MNVVENILARKQATAVRLTARLHPLWREDVRWLEIVIQLAASQH